MSYGFTTDNNKDIDSDAQVARRRSLLERLERKYEFKAAIEGTHDAR